MHVVVSPLLSSERRILESFIASPVECRPSRSPLQPRDLNMLFLATSTTPRPHEVVDDGSTQNTHPLPDTCQTHLSELTPSDKSSVAPTEVDLLGWDDLSVITLEEDWVPPLVESVDTTIDVAAAELDAFLATPERAHSPRQMPSESDSGFASDDSRLVGPPVGFSRCGWVFGIAYRDWPSQHEVLAHEECIQIDSANESLPPVPDSAKRECCFQNCHASVASECDALLTCTPPPQALSVEQIKTCFALPHWIARDSDSPPGQQPPSSSPRETNLSPTLPCQCLQPRGFPDADSDQCAVERAPKQRKISHAIGTLPERILELAKQYWGIDALRPAQIRAIRGLLDKADVISVQPTGSIVKNLNCFKIVCSQSIEIPRRGWSLNCYGAFRLLVCLWVLLFLPFGQIN